MPDAVVELLPHPGAPHAAVRRLGVRVARSARGLRLRYRLEGDAAALRLPAPAAARRSGGLWRHTCFEAFLRPAGGTAYCEFNFSLSGEWAAYGFADRRLGMQDLALPAAPVIGCRRQDDGLELEATLDLPAGIAAATLEAGLAAVVEAQDGSLSYWALRHPPGPPDFHDPAGFALALDTVPATETR